MASYQTRHRDPLLDSETQAVLERRSKELLGIALIVVGVLGAMICFSYSPTDPSWISASDAPVQNWLGVFGAATAAPLMMIVGKGILGAAAGPDRLGHPLCAASWVRPRHGPRHLCACRDRGCRALCRILAAR